MRAVILTKQDRIERTPLKVEEIPTPSPGKEEVLLSVKACGVCRTDLHIVEGELPLPKSPLILGHQVVGIVEKKGELVQELKEGDRVGVPWFYSSCGECKYCKEGRENLCKEAKFTGYHVDGGYAEFMVASKRSVYLLPSKYKDEEIAPLLCGGVIGYRAFKLSGVSSGQRLGLFGFGSSAHIILQLAVSRNIEVYVFTRTHSHRVHAQELGARWVGKAGDIPPHKLDACIIFSPAGWLVPQALRVLDRGGALVLAGIYMTPTPSLDYSLLYEERSIKSVANSTREDVVEFLQTCQEIDFKTSVEVFPLKEANQVLTWLKESRIKASGVLIP